MTKKILFFILIFSALVFSLFSCGDGEDESFTGKVVKLNVYNWGEYISDGFEGSYDSNAEFEEYFNKNLAKKYGFKIEVNYTTYANNEEMYQKIKSGAGSYDIIVPSDYMIEKMISEGLVQKLDKSLLTNFGNISDDFMGNKAVYDPGNEYSVPYTYGMVGIIVNTELVDEEDYEKKSWDLLWNTKYAGKLLQFNNPRDAFGTAMYYKNINVNSTEKSDWDMALEVLMEQRPLIQGYVNDEIFNKMTTASAVAAPYYAGDFLTMAGLNEDLWFYYPDEGTNYFVDAMCIPSTCDGDNLIAAHEYINFMLAEEAAVANALYIGYASPNKLVVESEEYREGMAEVYEDWYEILYGKTPNEVNEKYDYEPAYKDFTPEIQGYVNSLWESLKTENSTELWVHIASLTIVVAVLALAVYTTYVKKKRSRDYRMRDKALASAKKHKP